MWVKLNLVFRFLEFSFGMFYRIVRGISRKSRVYIMFCYEFFFVKWK